MAPDNGSLSGSINWSDMPSALGLVQNILVYNKIPPPSPQCKPKNFFAPFHNLRGLTTEQNRKRTFPLRLQYFDPSYLIIFSKENYTNVTVTVVDTGTVDHGWSPNSQAVTRTNCVERCF